MDALNGIEKYRVKLDLDSEESLSTLQLFILLGAYQDVDLLD